MRILALEEDGKCVYQFKENNVLYKKMFLRSPEKVRIIIPREKYILKNNKTCLKYKVYGDSVEKNIKIDYFVCE